MATERAQSPTAVVVVFYAFLTVAALIFARVLLGFASDLVLGLLLAALCRPAYDALLPWVRGRTWLASLLLCTALGVVAAVVLVWLTSALAEQATLAFNAVREALRLQVIHEALFGDGWFATRARALATVAGIDYHPEALRGALSEVGSGLVQGVSLRLTDLVGSALSMIFHVLIVVLILFYALIDADALKRRALAISPLPDDEEEHILGQFKEVARAILVGNVVCSALQGLLCGVAMWVTGFSSPLFWGVMLAFVALLPLVGISVVVWPATAYLALHDRWIAASVFFGFCTLQSLAIDNVLKPKLIGDRMRMHSLLIFLSLLGGLSVFGVMGILYGPLAVAFFMTMLELYETKYRDRVFGST